jgi:hypothetical protein
MAWQLIYTSAPRLLEAGRTGFGTVARHRAVSGMLASSVERFSQFARLPGHDPRRSVHAHRILTVGSGTYHVLSCLQDAGSDYTGRTNHIAHHLIAEPREIRALASTGLTPADVLLAMAWRTSWSEGPRFLDPAEEVDLSSFATSNSHAWTAVTGTPASAGILWSREALKGCYLITPAGINALELFRESLLVEPAQAWQTRFTTCLEPNDDVADFRWVALSSSSPLRAQVETSSRLVLDLTRPGTLPAPPEPEVPASAPEAVRPPSPEPAHTMPAAAQAQTPLPGAAPAPVHAMGGWSPEPRPKAAKSSKSFIGLSLIIAALLVVTVLGGLLRQDGQQQQARTAYDSEIAKTWTNYKLILHDTRKLLEDQPNLEEGTALLKSHEEFFRSMQQLLNKPGMPVHLPLPAENKDDLRDLSKLLEEWAELHVKPWVKLQTGKEAVSALTIHAAYRNWQDSRAAKWKQLTAYLLLRDIPLPGDQVVQTLKAEAKEVLRQAEPARGSLSNWEQLFELLGHQKNNVDPEVRRWLNLWIELDGASDSAYATAKTASADTSLPDWLRTKAATLKQRHDQENERGIAAKNKHAGEQHAQEVQRQLSSIEDADAIAAGNPIFIHLLQSHEDPAGKVSGLPVTADMQLFIGTAWDAHPRPDGKTEPKNGELKKWVAAAGDNNSELKFGPSLFAKLTDMILFSNIGTLTAFPEHFRKSPDGVRVVARSKDATRVLFDLRLIPLGSVVARPIFTQIIETTVDNADNVTLSLPAGFLSRLHLLGLPTPVYSLRRDGTATEQKFYELKAAENSSFQVMPPQVKMPLVPALQDVRRQISELESGIAKDDKDLAANESSKISARLKEEKRETYTKGRSDKEIRLQDLRAQLQSLEGQTPLHFDLLPGKHTLLLEQPGKLELAGLNVVPAAKASQPKPPNP